MSWINEETTDAGGTLTREGVLKAFEALQRATENARPAVSRMYATHSVPYGRVFRMWTTRGELIAYVNRGQIADMPRAETVDFGTRVRGFHGVPVYFD